MNYSCKDVHLHLGYAFYVFVGHYPLLTARLYALRLYALRLGSADSACKGMRR